MILKLWKLSVKDLLSSMHLWKGRSRKLIYSEPVISSVSNLSSISLLPVHDRWGTRFHLASCSKLITCWCIVIISACWWPIFVSFNQFSVLIFEMTIEIFLIIDIMIKSKLRLLVIGNQVGRSSFFSGIFFLCHYTREIIDNCDFSFLLFTVLL